MQVVDAFVSGSLGQAVYREDRAFRILDAPQAEPREALPNEIQWFRHAAREVAPVHAEGLPVALEVVRSRLEEETRFFRGLDGLLVGMDPDFSAKTRTRAISRAEEILSANGEVARRIRQRFLIPANAQEWDAAGALALALEHKANSASACYRLLAAGIIDRLADDIAAVVLDKAGDGVDAARRREIILRSGIVAELADIEAQADRKALSALLFRSGDFPELRLADPSGQILAAIIQRVDKRIALLSAGPPIEHQELADEPDDAEAQDQSDPIVAAVERALANDSRRWRWSVEGSSADLPGIQSQITWIGERLKFGDTVRAEQALITLIDRQGRRSRAEDLVKTLTAVADIARGAKHPEWTLRLLAAIDHTGRSDAAALCVRAETLRDLGRHEEALAAFEETMRRFPQDDVAPNARAETLRELGRHEEALAAFEETMRRFPQNVVAPTARAETLRELGRPEEALAAFEETMRRFPRNEVAPTAGAETLRELGRPEEALAAFEETMRRFPRSEVAPNACADLLGSLGRLDEAEALLAAAAARSRTHGDWIAVHILAMARLRAGRVEEALAELDRGVRFCPFRDSRRYFETARPLALLAARRAAEAAREWEALAQDPTVDPRERTNILLFEAHARAEAGEPGRAQSLVTSAQVIDFAAAKQKRLAAALTERYGLVSGMWASGARAQQLSDDITALELELVRPKLWSFRARAA